jgi:hypothetical protein
VPLVFDDSQFPRVEVSWTGTVTDDELGHFIDKMDACFARAETFSLLIDTRGARVPTAEQRRRLLVHMRATAKAAEANLIQAVVIESAFIRTFYFGITWAIPMPFPSKVFAEAESAREWLERTLRHRKSADDASAGPK